MDGYWKLLAFLGTACILVACQGPAWESDPEVQSARIACAGKRKQEHIDCVLDQAVAGLNPDICRLMSAGLDELCLRDVYESASDPAICEAVYSPNAKKECRVWFDQNMDTAP